jgi:hypothetical protein
MWYFLVRVIAQPREPPAFAVLLNRAGFARVGYVKQQANQRNHAKSDYAQIGGALAEAGGKARPQTLLPPGGGAHHPLQGVLLHCPSKPALSLASLIWLDEAGHPHPLSPDLRWQDFADVLVLVDASQKKL